MASINGHFQIVKYLVEEHKADVHENNEYAMRMASSNGHFQIVKYLVEEHKADVHVNNEYAMRWASENGHFQIVKYLVDHNANIYNLNIEFHYDIYDNNEFIKYMLSKELDYNRLNKQLVHRMKVLMKPFIKEYLDDSLIGDLINIVNDYV
jgi:ankyrin repeat protein